MSKVILSLDGGGIRGAATAQFLNHIEDKLQSDYGKSLRDYVDFYAGTSTGSIIAIALATTDIPMSEINQFYNDQNAQKIFTKNTGWFEVDGINAPKYEGSGKSNMLKTKLGDIKLGNVAEGKHVLAVTYSIERRKPEIIKSTDASHRDLLAWQVADASSAAPTYFPSKDMTMNGVGDVLWLIDGGVTANNPTMCAIAEAIKNWPNEAIQDLRVLSIGTGYCAKEINGVESQEWGALGWITKGHILNVLSDERVVDYQASTILASGNYIRVNTEMKEQPCLPMPPDDAMDDISSANIQRLKAMGDLWFAQYGDAVVDLLIGQYQGPSLSRIDGQTGTPKIRE